MGRAQVRRVVQVGEARWETTGRCTCVCSVHQCCCIGLSVAAVGMTKLSSIEVSALLPVWGKGWLVRNPRTHCRMGLPTAIREGNECIPRL